MWNVGERLQSSELCSHAQNLPYDRTMSDVIQYSGKIYQEKHTLDHQMLKINSVLINQ